MKKIPLSKRGKNKGKYFALVDDKDFNFLNQWNWYVSFDDKTPAKYAKRKLNINGKVTTISMHRAIMKAKLDAEIDHRDKNGLNCQRHNLRKCTHSQNMKNRISARNSSSKYLGVSFDKRCKKWVAHIKVNKKNISLGRFFTEEQAALAYNKAAKQYHGKFASLNIISKNVP